MNYYTLATGVWVAFIIASNMKINSYEKQEFSLVIAKLFQLKTRNTATHIEI